MGGYSFELIVFYFIISILSYFIFYTPLVGLIKI